MDSLVARALLRVVDAAIGERAIRMPPGGGSVPMHLFEELGLPVIGVPMVNHDNHQHAANENLRLGNLWRRMEIYGAILATIEW